MNLYTAAKPALRSAALMVGLASQKLRRSPDFIIVGASRSGTTSLHRALLTHPGTLPPVFTKGVHYFDVAYPRGSGWYQAHFPLRSTPGTCFESSGYYLHHPLAPQRIAADLPGARAVVMLRDPVERAYSAYKHELARGFETVPTFEQALDLEPDRLAGEVERIVSDPAYVSHAHRHQSYTDRGRYAEQLARLISCFGRDRVHVLFSEDFFATPEPVYEHLLDFLGLPLVHPPSYERHNARRGSALSAATRQRLRDQFAGPDQDLADLLGRSLPWRQ